MRNSVGREKRFKKDDEGKRDEKKETGWMKERKGKKTKYETGKRVKK